MEIGPYFQLNSANNFTANPSVVDSITVRDRATSWKKHSRTTWCKVTNQHKPFARRTVGIEEYKQWCDHRRIILAWRFARTFVYPAGPANPPVLQAMKPLTNVLFGLLLASDDETCASGFVLRFWQLIITQTNSDNPIKKYRLGWGTVEIALLTPN